MVAHQDYRGVARALLQPVEQWVQGSRKKHPKSKDKLLKIEAFMNHAQRQIQQIERCVIQGETLPHAETVFSIFEPYTEWLSKGKAGVPVELGLAVGSVEEQDQFILHHRVMPPATDVDIAVPLGQATQARFPELSWCSFAQGLHAPDKQSKLAEWLETVILPQGGRLSQVQQAREPAQAFREGRRQHAAIESALQALESHGLDRCPDRGLPAFRRYVAVAVVARNIQVVGRYLQRQEQQLETEPYRKAA